MKLGNRCGRASGTHPPRGNASGRCKSRAAQNTFVLVIPDLRPIIDDIAKRADDFLAGARDRSQARAGIEEVITIDYPTLNPADRTVVIAGVMSVLEEEDFFGTEYVGDPFRDDEEDDD